MNKKFLKKSRDKILVFLADHPFLATKAGLMLLGLLTKVAKATKKK